MGMENLLTPQAAVRGQTPVAVAPQGAVGGVQAQAQAPQTAQAVQPPSGHYNGKVTYDGKTYEVVNSKVVVDGKVLYVSSKGELVMDEAGRFIGTIQDGKFLPSTPELADQMKQKGYLE